ncbi:unnamed protein product [Cuscuta campestris]|uniref:DUF4283 domain-containing protein n=1 Tax=Cuscuta campestris TaxID=132261 RepID=A0A484M0B3_9ASTE|nr:unnamed protein product [Cuscuta campestris]
MGKKSRSKEPAPPTPLKKKVPELKVDDEVTVDTVESDSSCDEVDSVNDALECEIGTEKEGEDDTSSDNKSNSQSIDEEAVEKDMLDKLLEQTKDTSKVFEKKPEPTPKKNFADLLKNNRGEKQGMQLFKVDLPDTEEVFLPKEAILPVEEIWGYCLVGCFAGKFPGLKAIQKMVDSWGVPCEILPHKRGWIVFKFWTDEHRQAVMTKPVEEITINKKLMFKILEKDFMWNCKSFATMPVWVKFVDVPMGFWSPLGLSLIASKLGTPLYSDGVTYTAASKFDTSQEPNAARKVTYCRVMVNMDLFVKPPLSVKVAYDEGNYIQKVEYEDMPEYCYHCEAFGHNPFDCKALHEIHRKRFLEKERLEELARIEALKEAKLAEAKAKGTNKPNYTYKAKNTDKQPAPKVPTANDVPILDENKGKKAVENEVTQKPSNDEDPAPSFSVKNPNDGDTLIGTGVGTLTTILTKDSHLKEPPDIGGKGRRSLLLNLRVVAGLEETNIMATTKGVGIETEGGALALTADEGAIHTPWAIMGDFNCVANSNERLNCHSQAAYSMTDLFQFRINNDLVDSKSTGLQYTWNKGNKWAKLDRVLINHDWEAIDWVCWAEFKDMQIESDHCHVVLNLIQNNSKGTPLLSYHPSEFLGYQSGGYKAIQRKIKTELVLEGDKCTKYFHALMRKQHASNSISFLTTGGGGVTSSLEDIVGQFTGYYTNLFGHCPNVMPIDWSVFQEGNVINPMEALTLNRNVHIDEVKEALFSIGNDKAPRPDGFTASFFKRKWNMVGQTVFEAVDEFFRSGKLLKQINHATVAPIPKVKENPDDLMLFSRGDITSVKVLADALKHFSQVSGLHVNPQKSNIHLAGQIKDNKEEILILVQFPLGQCRYLGLPLTSQRASERDFAPLISKVEENIRRWNTKTLSQAGRVELIRSVIQGIQSSWLQAFPVHKSVLNRIITICRTFLWGSKFSKVTWSDIYKPLEEGGLGLRNSYTWNQAFLIKNLWNIASHKDTLWVKWVHSVYLQDRDVWTWTPKKGDSHLSKKLSIVRDLMVEKCGELQMIEEYMHSLCDNGTLSTSKVYDLIRTRNQAKPWMKFI